MDEKELFQRLDGIVFRLDRMISLMEESAKRPSVLARILNLIALGATILGILTVVDTIRNWFGG